MKMTIYGASDDLLEIESDTFREEFDVPGSTEVLVVDPEGNTLIVTAEFGAAGRARAEWTLSVLNTDGATATWPIQFGERPGYESDPAIILEVPEGTEVRELS
jgi:hypothetical protein